MSESPTQFNVSGDADGTATLPTIGDLKSTLTAAASAGASAVTAASQGGADLTGAVKTGWEAFSAAIEGGLASLVNEAATAVGGPVLGGVASVVTPTLIQDMATAIGTLFDKIGAELPPGLKTFLDKI